MSRVFSWPGCCALGLLACGIACGTERIELRFQPAEITPQPVEPDDAAAGDGLLVPDAQLPGAGCQKVDFLFVIDDSFSMIDEQQNLTRSFPGFVQIMQQVVQAQDFHMMVVSTSGAPEDEGAPALDAGACEEIQGAGKRRGQFGEDCGIQGGLSYMTEAQPDLESTFACVAQVGVIGAFDEQPAAAMLGATSAGLNAAGRCNDGFLRQDAILVVTLISDGEETGSVGDPADWHEQLLQAKGGDPNAIVMLGLVGDNNIDGGLPWGPCAFLEASGAPRLQELVDGFGGVLGSVCAPDYAPFFETAVDSIDSACQSFVPPVIL